MRASAAPADRGAAHLALLSRGRRRPAGSAPPTTSPTSQANELLYRRVDIEDVVSAHRLALEKRRLSASRAISSRPRTPFSPTTPPTLERDAQAVTRRLFPDCRLALRQARLADVPLHRSRLRQPRRGRRARLAAAIRLPPRPRLSCDGRTSEPPRSGGRREGLSRRLSPGGRRFAAAREMTSLSGHRGLPQRHLRGVRGERRASGSPSSASTAARRAATRLRDGDGRPLAEAQGAGGNLYVDFDAAIAAADAQIEAVCAEAGANCQRPGQMALGIGLAGLSSPCRRKRVEAPLPNFASVRAANDAVAGCLGAHGGGDGRVSSPAPARRRSPVSAEREP